jgi:RNA-directed DNA polymerase
MPLGNLTSQFFANDYLNELDYFIKHHLKAKYYIRYVDDFVIMHTSKAQLELWKQSIDKFLRNHLKLELNRDKSKIYSLSKGIDFVGFRNFYLNKLLRIRTIKKIKFNIKLFEHNNLSYINICEIFQGWQAHVKWANTFLIRKQIAREIAITRYKNSFQ